MSIYKDCDIRGVYGRELNDSDAYAIGMALGTLLHGRCTVVGGDVRSSTPALKEQCIRGLMECGAQIYDIGSVTTPMMYFAKKHLGTYGGIMITASHNPAKYNGIKIMFGNTPVSTEFIKNVEALVKNGEFIFSEGRLEKRDIRKDYLDSFTGKFSAEGVKVVLDCCDGAASLVAPEAARMAGCRVTELFCGIDGSFPNRNPNPAVYSNLSAMQEKVRLEKADFGAAFDGDGDRVVFCDEKGQIITSEESLVIFAGRLLKSGASLVYDQKSCSTVADYVKSLGAEPIMERSGHAFIKKTFLEHNSALAGEISGHFFFGSLGFDDGLFAALLMAEILKKSGKNLSELSSAIPKKLITPDIRIPMAYEKQQELLDRLSSHTDGFRLILLDGVRLENELGWILVRKSVTEEAITVRLESGSRETMKALADRLCEVLPEVKESVYTEI